MAKETKQRQALIERLHLAGRASSTATVTFHAAVAARRALAPSDTKTLDLLLREGPLTHGELVRREPHPDDGRRVLITADPERAFAEMAPLFESWVSELETLYATYTDDQLETIADFLERAAARQAAITQNLANGF